MDVCFSLQGSCTLADNLVFRIITFFFFPDIKTPNVLCNRAEGNWETGMSEEAYPMWSGALVSNHWEGDWDGRFSFS